MQCVYCFPDIIICKQIGAAWECDRMNRIAGMAMNNHVTSHIWRYSELKI